MLKGMIVWLPGYLHAIHTVKHIFFHHQLIELDHSPILQKSMNTEYPFGKCKVLRELSNQSSMSYFLLVWYHPITDRESILRPAVSTTALPQRKQHRSCGRKPDGETQPSLKIRPMGSDFSAYMSRHSVHARQIVVQLGSVEVYEEVNPLFSVK